MLACRSRKKSKKRHYGKLCHRRFGFEPLEKREMLSVSNLLAEFAGILSNAGNVERIPITIAPENLGITGDKVYLGFQTQCQSGNFDPAAVVIRAADGTVVTPELSTANLLGKTDSVVVAGLGKGDYTLEVSGAAGTGQYKVGVYLTGDVDGDHTVNQDDLTTIRQIYGSQAGDSKYQLTADVNLDGRINAIDLSMARRNNTSAQFAAGDAGKAVFATNITPFAEFVGVLNQAGDVEKIPVTVSPKELGVAGDKAFLGFQVTSRSGGSLDPAAIQIRDAKGNLVALECSTANLAGRTDSVVVAGLGAGNYTLEVSGTVAARSQYQVDVFLVGDVDGDHAMGQDDLATIREIYGSTAGDGRYLLAADANLDGRIDAKDLSLARRNLEAAPAANLLAEFAGVLKEPDGVAQISMHVDAAADVYLAFQTKGQGGGDLDPAALRIRRADGTLVELEYAIADLPGSTDSMVVAALGKGDYTLEVSGEASTRSHFDMDVFLVGDMNGDHAVMTDDLAVIWGIYGSSAGDCKYQLLADANLDGRINAIDFSPAMRNQNAGTVVISEIEPLSLSVVASSGCDASTGLIADEGWGGVYDRVAGITPTGTYKADAPMQFFESTKGWVQPLGSATAPQGGVLYVPVDPVVTLGWFYREAGYGNDLVMYRVDDVNGTVDGIAPGESGYIEAATDQSRRLTDPINSLDCPGHQYDLPSPNRASPVLDGGTYYSFYIIQGSNGPAPKNYKWFVFSDANVDGYQHVQEILPGDPLYVSGSTITYRIEDLSNNIVFYPNPDGSANDADFNDVVFSVKEETEAFPTLTAYPYTPNAFSQTDSGTRLHAQDTSGGFSQVIGYGDSSVGDDYVISGNATFNAMCEMGFLARGDMSLGHGYVLSLDPTNSHFKLTKLTSTSTSTTLVDHTVSGLTVSAGDTLKITFEINGSAITGKLYNSAGVLLDTISTSDGSYSTGAVGTWASKITASIEGTWSCMSLIEPMVAMSGVSAVNEGSTYTLNLHGWAEDTIAEWVVDWGDGSNEDTYTTSGPQTHVYADGPEDYTITLTATTVAGALDTTFGIGGKATTDFGYLDDARSVVVQSDGKIIVAGATGDPTTGKFKYTLVRYNTNGTLDTNFGTGGKVTTVFDGNDDQAFSLLLQSDGKIVVAGTSGDANGNFNFTLARYTSAGVLDTSFGSGGKVTTDLAGIDDQAYCVAIQSTGKIIVAGSTRNGSSCDFALARYTTGGVLDTTFGTSGKTITNFSGTSWDEILGMTIQLNDYIVVAGRSEHDFALARYTASGALDNNFGTGGKVTTDFASDDDQARSVAIQSDGKIVVAGYAYNGTGYDFALARYTTAGVLDTTFNGSGKVTTNFSGLDRAFGIKLQTDGKIVVTGVSDTSKFAVARYTTGGALDTTFGSGGKIATAFDGYANSAAFQSDGKIIIAGRSFNGRDDDFTVARYTLSALEYTAAKDVSVLEVAPTMALIGADAAGEDIQYTLTLGEVVDGGNDPITTYIIHWGDGDDTTVPANELPENRQLTHTYTTGPATVVITADLVSEGQTYVNVGMKSVKVDSEAPTVDTAATYSDYPDSITGTTTTLSVLGDDDAGEENLTYTWTATVLPTGADQPTYSVNGTNAAKNTVATFSQWGDYEFTVTIEDVAGRYVTSSIEVTVDQTLTSVVVTAGESDLSADEEAEFSAVACDQFGEDMAMQPTVFSWNATSGSISPSSLIGYYTAPNSSTVDVITATATIDYVQASGKTSVTVTNHAPTVVTPASGTMNSATTATLSVTADDDQGESFLVYTWTATPLTVGAVAPDFDANNGTDDGNVVVATFHSAGYYRFTVTITDTWGYPAGVSTTSTNHVTVDQILSNIQVDPSYVYLDAGETQQFEAVGYDQFTDYQHPYGHEMIEQPAMTWTVATGPGTIDEDTGLYTAPNDTGYPYYTSATITAESGTVVSSASSVYITNNAPTVDMEAAASMDATGLTASLTVLGTDDAGESNLTYNWTILSKPSGVDDPTFSVNNSNDACFTTATFSALGAYNFRVTIEDAGGRTTYDDADMTITQVLTSITLSPLSPSVDAGDTQPFTATGKDQFDDTMTIQPEFAWSATTGAIDEDGNYTAPNTSLPAGVTVDSDGVSASTTITITNSSSASSPITIARLGDSWIEPLWEDAQGVNSTLRDEHLSHLAERPTVVVDTAYSDYTVDPEEAFQPGNKGNFSSTPSPTVTQTVVDWYDSGVHYVATETDTSVLEIYSTLVGQDWTYLEEWTSSYTIVTTADSDPYSTASGEYNYTFDASGNATDSSYTCVITATGTATAPYTSGTWTQTVDNTDTIANDTTASTRSGSEYGSGGPSWSYSDSEAYSGGGISGSVSHSGHGEIAFDYSIDHTWSSGSGWAWSGSASNRASGSSHYSYSGSGVYEDEDYLETQIEYGSDHFYYDYTTYYSLSSSTWEFTSGIGGTSGSGGSHYSYDGDGTYSSSDDGQTMSGTYEQSGEDNSSYSYTTTASGTSSGWTESGTMTGSDSGDSHYSYSGSGSYWDSGSSFYSSSGGGGAYAESGSGWSRNGTTSESGGDDDSYAYTTHYALSSDRTWEATSGSGGSEGNGYTHSSYSGSGDYYWFSASGTIVEEVFEKASEQTMDGTFAESGHEITSYGYSTEATCTSGEWTETGTKTESRDRASHYSYNGGGTYLDSDSNFSVRGTLGESGRDDYSYSEGTGYSLSSDGGWEATSGSADAENSGETHWSYLSYSGASGGSYSFDAEGGTIYGTFEESGNENTSYYYHSTATCTSGAWSESGSGSESQSGESAFFYAGSGSGEREWSGWSSSGTLSESGGSEDSYEYTLYYDLDLDGNWMATSGSGGSSGSGETHSSYGGSGSYSGSTQYYGFGGSIIGEFNQEQSEGTSYEYETHATYASGAWSESGSGSSTESGFTFGEYDGSGSYSGHGSYGYTGSLIENGNAGNSYSYTKYYDLADAVWLATSGSGGSSGSGETHSAYSGVGSYWSSYPRSYWGSWAGNFSGAASENGGDNTSYEFETTATYADGDWTETGTKTSSGSGGATQSYSGDCSCTLYGQGWSGSGSAYTSGSDGTSYDYTKHYSLDGNGFWQAASGSGTASGSGSMQASFSVTGPSTIYHNVCGYINVDIGADASDQSSYDYTEHYTLAPDDVWLAGSGSGGMLSTGGIRYTYSESSPYSASRYVNGTESVSGTCEASGYDDISYNYETDAVCTRGLWAETGVASIIDEGETSFSYSGVGKYQRSLLGSTVEGTTQESGSGATSYYYSTSRILKPDGNWSTPTGSGSASGSTNDHWSYTGDGDYSSYASNGWYRPEGTLAEYGQYDNTSQYNTTSTRDAGGNWLKAGTQTVLKATHSGYSYSGSTTSGDQSYSDSGNGNYASQHAEEFVLNSAGSYWSRSDATNAIDGHSNASFNYDYSFSYSGGSDQWHAINTTSSELQERSNGVPYYSSGNWYYNPVGGSRTETTISHGEADRYSTYSGAWYTSQDEYGASDGCQQEWTEEYSPSGTTYSSSCTNPVNGSWEDSESNSDSYNEVLSYPGYRYSHYSPVEYDSPPMTGYSGGLVNYGLSNYAPSQSNDFMTGVVGGPSHWYVLDSYFGPTLVSTASWMVYSQNYYLNPTNPLKPTSLALLTSSPAAQMTIESTYMPWSAKTHGAPPLDGEGGIPLMGRCLAVAEPQTTCEYDDKGRVTSITDANSGTTGFTYDPAGNLKTITDPNGNITTWAYDDQNRVTEETDALGASRYFAYDEAGDLVRYVDRNGRVREYQYDPEHRVVVETWYEAEAGDGGLGAGESDPIPNPQSPIPSNTIRYEYDKAGRLISESDNYSSIIYVYDDAGRLTTTTQANPGMPTVTLTNSYTGDSAKRSSVSATIDSALDFVNDYWYDDQGRVTAFGQHGGGLSQFSSDENGTVPLNAVAEKYVDLSYDAAGNMTFLSRYAGNQLVGRSDYGNADGLLTGLVHHQGQTIFANYRWTYDGGLSQFSSDENGTVPLLSQSILPIHDTAGIVDALQNGTYTGALLTDMLSSDGSVHYTYDSTGQLIGATYAGGVLPDETYQWDANGNSAGSGYLVGLDNRLLSDGTYRYEYDAEGNRVARYIDVDKSGTLTEGDTDVTAYTWDNRNRLVAVTDYEKAGGSPTQVVDYIYDVEDHWIGKDVDFDGDGVIDSRTRFAYDGNQIILQFDGTGSDPLDSSHLSHRYLWQPDVIDQLMADEQVSDATTPGEVLWTLGDHLGTVRDLASYDNKSGATTIANHRVFDSFGKLEMQTNAAVNCLFGFTGKPVDNNTGLRSHWRRWTDPETADWMSKDPTGFTAGDTNTRRYVGNTPTVLVDPTGLWEQVTGTTNLWRATDTADTFYSLVTLVNKNLAPDKNAMCIMPKPSEVDQATADAMREKWGKVNNQGDVPQVAVGGVYDVSSLLKKRDPNAAPVAVSVGADGNGYIAAASAFFSAGTPYLSGSELAAALQTISKNGDSPIGTLILIGHGNEGANAVGGRRDRSGHGSKASFKLADMMNIVKQQLDRILIYDNQNHIAYWPTYDEAIAGKLPPVAWLATDAVVYVVGCHTDKFAGTIAKKWLRSDQAEAWGTLLNTWAFDGGMGWGNKFNTALDRSLPVSTTPEEYFKEKQEHAIPEHNETGMFPGRNGAGRVRRTVHVPKQELSPNPMPVWRIVKGTKS